MPKSRSFRREPLGQLHQDPASAVRGQGAVAQMLQERLPLRELHDQAGRVLRLAEIDDPHHGGVLHAGEQAGLAPEALAHAWLLADLPAEHLQGHPPAQAHLLGQVHLAHAATPEVAQDTEALPEDE